MPTAARLAAAVCFALLGWGASDLIVDALPFERNLGWFYEINTLIAALCGWFIAGSRAPAGYGGAISYGLTATAGFIFWGLLFHSSHEMIQLSLRRQYDNAMEAVVAVFDIGLEFGQIMLTQDIILTFLIGGIVAGMVTEWFGQRFE